MQLSLAGALRPLQGLLKAILVVLALLALLLTTSFGAARPARAATAGAGSGMKAVFIVGPSGDSSLNKTRSDAAAARAAAHGMTVVKLYTPHATWSAVLNAVNGANLVSYMGHGNGWPSPYGPYQEDTKDGMGLNASDGSSTVKYYGAKHIRSSVTLASNAIVFLNHLCYASGNGEPGMAIPTYDVARQRVDNYANGFLYAGARAVFAYATGNFDGVIDALFTTTKTVDQIFSTSGGDGTAYYGFVGWNDKYFYSERMPGFQNHLDPESSAGYRRALSGDMGLTPAEWMSGAGGGSGGTIVAKPTVGPPSASFNANTGAKTKVSLRLTWVASPSPNVVSYDLQFSMDSGTWTTIGLATPTSLSATVALAASHAYRFRLRATDAAMTVGDWVTTASRNLSRAQEKSTLLGYSGTWSSRLYLSGASGNYVRKASGSGNTVRYAFTGTDVGFVTTLAASRGKAEIWLDGNMVATLDLYSATTAKARLVWVAAVSAGDHVVEVRATGAKNASSTSSRVDMDAFVSWK